MNEEYLLPSISYVRTSVHLPLGVQKYCNITVDYKLDYFIYFILSYPLVHIYFMANEWKCLNNFIPLEHWCSIIAPILINNFGIS